MKKYKVDFSEIKITTFEVEAHNKKEAKDMVEEIIVKSSILNLGKVRKKLGYKFDITKINKEQK